MKNLFKKPGILLIILSFLLVISCKKDEIPSLTTSAITNLTGISAASGGTITSEGTGTVLSRGVCWSTGTTPTIADNKTIDGAGAGNFTSNLTGLNGASVYYVRAYATNGTGTGYGMAMSFTTLGQVPAPTTATATNINTTSATLNGSVNPNYLSTVVTIEYGTTTSYGSTVVPSQSPLTGNINSSVTADITGLTVGTVYHYRIKTVNSLGTTYGNDLSFTTLGQVPTVTTIAATNITSITAQLNGTVNGNYLSTIVTFEYGLTTGYGSTMTATQSPVTGNSTISANATISGLTAGSIYHVRVKAVNSLGTSFGSDITFTPKSVKYGLYTVKTGTDELYFIDLDDNSMTKVANIGVPITNMVSAIQYKNNKLYIITLGNLYTYDLMSGLLTLLITNTKLQWQFSINSAGDLYSVWEASGPAPGTMYKIDISSNTSVTIGTTGTPSVWGLGFDSSDKLWAVDEFYQRYGTMNLSSGTFTPTSSTIPYTDTYYSTPDNNGNLYSFNVGSPSGIVKYNISANTATLLIPLSVNWSGLAYGPH